MKSLTTKFITGFAVLALSLFAGGITLAQDAPEAQPPADSQPPADTQPAPQVQPPIESQYPSNPPGTQNPQNQQQGPGMARISMVRGDVSTQRGDSGDWSAATLNTPMAPGDKVSTGDKGRVEVQLDFADVLRLADSSQATLTTLQRTQIQLQLGEGLAYFSMFKGHEADVEIDTPNVAIHPIGHDGAYRIYVNPGGQTEITVRNGEAEISTPQGSTRVKKGDLITIQGDSTNAQYKITGAANRDDWDAFNEDRDRQIQKADAWRNTDRRYTGSQDLDNYGVWSEVPDVGRVWTPQQGPDWAPYRDGNWVWEPYYGWTWVGYEPWGWAPYHYGRWFVNGGAWAWWPGPVGYPVWSPAYVSFFGYGPGFGVGFGWFPCGPGDFFFPWWGGFGFGFGFVDGFRFGERGFWGGRGFDHGFRPLLGNERFSNFRNFESNARLRNGFSGLSADHFGRGAAFRPGAVNANAFRTGKAMTGGLPVVPSHESLSASGRFQNAGQGGARSNGNQRFFGKTANAARPESFSQTASHLQNSIQRDGHFSPVTAENHGAASPASGAREGSGSFNSRNSAGAEGNRGATNERPTNNSPTRGANTETRPSASGSSNPSASRPTGNTAERPTLNGNSGSASRPTPESNARPSTNNGWHSFGSPNGGSRPPLNMNKPIVTQRPGSGGSNAPYGTWGRGGTSPSSRAPSYPGGGSRPSYGAPSRPSYGAPSRPSYGSDRSRTASYGAPSRPGYSAPRQSAPSSRAPSYHAPSGGSSHGSGGGSHSSGGGHSSGGHSSGGHSSGGGGGHSHR